jgi:chromosome partitioning protein
MDPQGNLTSAFGLEKRVNHTVADSLLDRNFPLPVLPVENGGVKKLDVVPASVPLASAEAALMNKLGRELRLRDHLLQVDSRYDFILIDTPPSTRWR